LCGHREPGVLPRDHPDVARRRQGQLRRHRGGAEVEEL
ncbi:hypothetical protein AK812_SmicGene48434, partial [Symbiodinium microadriaticum]